MLLICEMETTVLEYVLWKLSCNVLLLTKL